uniref:Glypican-3 n=1 Tax=Salarias fasciatus TaxID=181472 RepID=A0A672HCW7_SALFA
MGGSPVRGALFLCAFLQLFRLPGGQVPNCQEVRAVFQSLHPGSKWVPETPVSGADLQVCQTKGPTCCSKKMEERYQVAARGNMESGLQVVSAQLKRLIIQNAAIFQEAFDLVLRHGRNSTLAVLKSEFPGLGGAAQSSVGQLFLDMSLYILGSDSTVDHMVAALYGRLFPLAYRRLLGGGAAASASEECVRGAWKDSGAFGPYPKLMMTRLSRSLLATRVFLQALNLGIEVVNTTDHLRPGRDCGRALLRLWYCPHCQGMLGPPACRGFCQAVMHGCLGGAAEVQPHWRSYIDGLGKLAAAMRGEQDMEAVVLRLPSMIRLSDGVFIPIHLLWMVLKKKKCWPESRRPQFIFTSPLLFCSRTVIKPSQCSSSSACPRRCRDFITSLRGFSSFYSGLGEALCSREPAPANDSLCWNGQEMTDRYGRFTLRSVSKLSLANKPPEPVISQIIDKLKHINQVSPEPLLPVSAASPIALNSQNAAGLGRLRGSFGGSGETSPLIGGAFNALLKLKECKTSITIRHCGEKTVCKHVRTAAGCLHSAMHVSNGELELIFFLVWISSGEGNLKKIPSNCLQFHYK